MLQIKFSSMKFFSMNFSQYSNCSGAKGTILEWEGVAYQYNCAQFQMTKALRPCQTQVVGSFKKVINK